MAALMEVDATNWQAGCGLGRVFEEVLMMKMTPAHLQTVTPARETESWSKADGLPGDSRCNAATFNDNTDMDHYNH